MIGSNVIAKNLAKFHRDIEGYSALGLAGKSRLGGILSREMGRHAGIDELFLTIRICYHHLIHTGRIIQDSPLEFVKRLKLILYGESALF